MIATEQNPIRSSHLPRHLAPGDGENGSDAVWALGNLDIFDLLLLGLFCSQKCPGDIIIKTFDAIRQLRDAGVPMVGGFHSPMEKECLDFLLRGKQPVVVCPARGIEGMRLPSAWKEPLASGRLLGCPPSRKKTGAFTADLALAQQRNRFVALLADSVLVPYAAPGSTTENHCRNLAREGKQIYSLADVLAQKILPRRKV